MENQKDEIGKDKKSFTVSDNTLFTILVLAAVLLFCYIATGDPLAVFGVRYTGKGGY